MLTKKVTKCKKLWISNLLGSEFGLEHAVEGGLKFGGFEAKLLKTKTNHLSQVVDNCGNLEVGIDARRPARLVQQNRRLRKILLSTTLANFINFISPYPHSLIASYPHILTSVVSPPA